MHHYITKRANIKPWFADVVRIYESYGPVLDSDGLVRFQRIEDAGQIEWNYTGSILPPKKYVLPPKEALFAFKNDIVVTEPLKNHQKKKIILGLHSCDLHALNLLDKAMGDGIHDNAYFLRRSEFFTIGVSCVPDESCFCDLTETFEPPRQNVDIFLTFLGDDLLIESENPEAKPLLDMVPDTRDACDKDMVLKQEIHNERLQNFKHRSINGGKKFSSLLEKEVNSPYWKELAQKCLSCGACTAVCPTCFCFDVWDNANLEGSQGVRSRQWDSCQTRCFTQVASGEIFRKNRWERIRHRFFRKFVYLKKRYGTYFCVGCGRCARACPVGINIPDAMISLSRSGEEIAKP